MRDLALPIRVVCMVCGGVEGGRGKEGAGVVAADYYMVDLCIC